MNRRLTLILLAAFGIATVCTLLVVRLVHNQSAARPALSTRVLAAKVDIKLGTVLKDDNLSSVEIAGTAPKDAILEKDKSSVIGRGVISDLYEGEPIIEDRLAGGKNGGMAAAIPLGMRACAVKVDDVVNVSGFVTPGMRVDVLISGTPPGVQNPTEGSEARTLLQNIQVLSAGTDYQKDAEGKPKQVQVVNLLVTPEQAETLSLVRDQVRIQLVLRNPMDTKTDPVVGTATANLFGAPTVAAPEKPHRAVAKSVAPQAFSIELLNGSKQSEEKFASPEGHQ
ncbi:MAG: Flp pilus assembly protein CpaB [Terracidiphilus sp.]|jgi:pilus assembly protein CpaB